jgi:hypothetical protein
MSDIIERFWEKVKIGEIGECWMWIGSRSPDGYGRISVNRKNKNAHRIAWELVYGKIPEGMQVLHHCDNPGCVFIGHLFLGTQQDNMRDRSNKGRVPCGEKHSNAKLTEADVNMIRKIGRQKTQREIGIIFGTHAGNVSCILLNKTWVTSCRI